MYIARDQLLITLPSSLAMPFSHTLQYPEGAPLAFRLPAKLSVDQYAAAGMTAYTNSKVTTAAMQR